VFEGIIHMHIHPPHSYRQMPGVRYVYVHVYNPENTMVATEKKQNSY
jgi:hypothetical protein